MDIKAHFINLCNKRRVHIEQLRIIRDQANTDRTTRRKLNRKIKREREQLAVIGDIWNVT